MAKKETKTTEFTGKTLETALNNDSLGNMQSTVALTGMVKKSKKKDMSVLPKKAVILGWIYQLK